MKTGSQLFATFALIAAFTFSTVFAIGQTSDPMQLSNTYKSEQNWIGAWKSFHGQQSDASWILNLVDDGTSVWSSKDGSQFIIVAESKADFPQIDDYELTEFPGNNSTCKMTWTGTTNDLDVLVASAEFQGTISGKNVKGQRIEMITDDNTQYTIIVMGTENTDFQEMEETGIAFMYNFYDIISRTASTDTEPK